MLLASGRPTLIHTGRGVAKIDSRGEVSYVHHSKGGHWLCLDRNGSFSRTRPEHFERITPTGVKPAILFSDGGSPIAVLSNGNLCYVSDDERMTPGGLHVIRNEPDGKLSSVSLGLDELTEDCVGIHQRQPRARARVVAEGSKDWYRW